MAAKRLSAAQERLLRNTAMRPKADRYTPGYSTQTAKCLIARGYVRATGFSGYVYAGIEITDAGREYLATLDGAKAEAAKPTVMDAAVTPAEAPQFEGDVTVWADYLRMKRALVDQLQGETDYDKRKAIKDAIFTLEKAHYTGGETPTEEIIVAPDLDVYEPAQAKVTIKVVEIEDPELTRLRDHNQRLEHALTQMRILAQSRMQRLMALEQKPAQPVVAVPTATVEPDSVLTDEITVKYAKPGHNGKNIVLTGHFTENIEDGSADRTNLLSNIQAWAEHKHLFILAGYDTRNPVGLIGSHILSNQDRERRVTAVRDPRTGEWYSISFTDDLKPGMVVIDRATKARRTIQKVEKDKRATLPGGFRTEDHFNVLFEDGSKEYSSKLLRWYLVWSPDAAAERLAA